ncbi:MAG: cytochrome P450 [Polyangiaceae bacterium]|nr:cytochrome P450 [Polyangiaceae bacterium]
MSDWLIDDLSPDAFSSGFPFETLSHLREDVPVFRIALPEGLTAWNLVRYDDVFEALRSPQVFSVPTGHLYAEDVSDPDEAEEPWEIRAMAASNAPQHGPMRQRLTPLMRRERIEAFRPHVRRIAEWEARSALDRGTLDAVDHFAATVAAKVVCAYLQIAPENHAYFRRLSSAFMGDTLLPPTAVCPVGLSLGPKALAAIDGAPAQAAMALIHESWREAPWLDASVVRDATRWEVEDIGLQSLSAGVAGLRNALVTAVLLLSGHWAQARRDNWLDRLPTVAEEILRHATPLLRARRIVTTAFRRHGAEFSPGDTVLLWLVGANFDPDQFAEPCAFRPLRAPNRHLSFGGGTHHCLGAPLARMEIEEIVRAVLQIWSEVEVVGPPQRYPSNVVHEFVSLPIRVA